MKRRVDDPRVSVVIPTYNRARDLRRCLDSLTAQTFGDFEVLICDDGSTDDTVAVVREYEPRLDIAYIRDANWGGPARPRNRGIAGARAPYIAFLDSDDWWSPGKLAGSLPFLDQGADVVYHDLFLATRADQRLFWRRVRSRRLTPPVYRDLITNGNGIPLSSAVARRSVLVAIAGMPEDRAFIAMEDFACWLNAARITDKFVRIPATLGYYWAGGGNTSGDARMIELLDVFEERYPEASAATGTPSWLAYARGQALYRLGAYSEAREHLGFVKPGRVPAMMMAKSVWMRLAMVLSNRDPHS